MATVGTIWASNTWDADAWAANTWADVAGDTTAPSLTSPQASASTPTDAVGSVVSDEANGVLYWVCTESGTAPNVAQIQAGQDNGGSAATDAGSQAVTATGSQFVAADGLTAETTYYIHFQQQDAATNDSTVVSSASFDTPAAGADNFEDRIRDGTFRRRFGGNF